MDHKLLYNTDGKAADQRIKKRGQFPSLTLRQSMLEEVVNLT